MGEVVRFPNSRDVQLVVTNLPGWPEFLIVADRVVLADKGAEWAIGFEYPEIIHELNRRGLWSNWYIGGAAVRARPYWGAP